MATNNLELLRLFLGDAKRDSVGNDITPWFDDPALQDMLDRANNDVDAAAAEGWRQKIGLLANTAYNVTIDNATLSRAALFEHAAAMVEFYEERAGDIHLFASIRLDSGSAGAPEGDELLDS